MKIVDIRNLTDEQLVHEELRIERAIIAARFRHGTGQLDDTSQFRKLRKDVARLRTVQREREVAQALPSDTLRNRHRGSFKPEAAPAAGGEGTSSGFLKGIVDKISGKE